MAGLPGASFPAKKIGVEGLIPTSSVRRRTSRAVPSPHASVSLAGERRR